MFIFVMVCGMRLLFVVSVEVVSLVGLWSMVCWVRLKGCHLVVCWFIFCCWCFCLWLALCGRFGCALLILLSEKVAKLKTKSVSVVEDAVVVLFLIVQDILVAIVQKVEIDPIDRRSSCIFTIVSASIVAPDMSISTQVLGKIRSVSDIKMFAISWSAFVMTLNVVESHQASLDHSIMPSLKNLLNLRVLIVPCHNPLRNTNNPTATSHACWLQLRWKQKIYPSWMNILLTAWKSLHVGWAGSGIIIIICQRFACICQSINSDVATSHVEHVSIWAWRWAWCAGMIATSAFAYIFVSNQWSQTNCILNPSGNTVALKAYRNSMWLCIVVWCTLLISTCSALTGIILLFISLQLLSSMAQNLRATLTPVRFQISQLSALQSYSFAENNSHLAQSVSSADCRSIHHMPCLVDFNHHLIISIMFFKSKSVPRRTCTW